MPDLSGQTLGKYRVIERLGRGGMADVYKAYQPGLDRYVAIKVMHPHLSEDPDFITRFQREAKSVAALRHPNIVQVFDFDVQDGNYYMVMEYVEGGQSLKEHLQALARAGERLPLENTLDIVAKLADALDYAHSQKMVHRDIKPANVLLPRLDQPLLSDFGIARLLGQTGLTASGAMIGTPAYMSPEQGRGERADERSDIYALGVVLYEMLTGKPPYDADTPFGVILKHINDPLISPRIVVGSIPESVERIVLKSLAKDPADRYQTAGQMRDALRVALVNLKSTLVSPSTATAISPPPAVDTIPTSTPPEAKTLAIPEPEMPLKKRPAWPIWIVGVVIALLVLGAGGFALNYLLNRTQTAVTTPIHQPPPPERQPQQPQQSQQTISPPQPASPLAHAWEQLRAGESEAALQLFNQALADNPNNIEALVGRGLIYIGQGQDKSAADDIFHARDLAPDNPLVQYGLAELLSRTPTYYDVEAALAAATKAINGCGQDLYLCAESYIRRAYILAWDLSRPQEAIPDMDRAIELHPDKQGTVPWLYRERGEMRLVADDPEGAIRDFETAFSLAPEYGELLESAAMTATWIGDYNRALGYYEQLLAKFPNNPSYLVGRGYVLLRAGNLPAARQAAEQALQSQPNLLAAHYLLGLVALKQEDTKLALDQFQQVLDSGTEDWEYGSPYFSKRYLFGHEIHLDLARAEWALGNPEDALRWIEQALAVDEWWPQPYILRGQILQQEGELTGARDNYLHAQEIARDLHAPPELMQEIDKLLASLGG